MSKFIKKQINKGHLRSVIGDVPSESEDNRIIELTWTTGSKGLRSGWDGQYYEELSMDPKHVNMTRLQTGAPLLAAHNSHDLSAVIGVVERAWLEGNTGKALVRFSTDPDADKIYQKVKEKVLRNVSIGYQVRKYEDVSEKGDAVRTYRATNWEPHEISIVPIGFDPEAQIRSQENISTEVEIEVSSDEETIIEETSVMTEEEKRALEAAAKKQAVLDEQKRQNEIRSLVRKANLGEPYADELLNTDGMTVDQARALVLERVIAAQAEAPKAPTKLEVTKDEGDKKRQGFEESILHRIDGVNFQVTDQAKQFAGKRLLRSLEEIFPRQMFESDSQYAIRAMGSSDLPLLLANVAHKSLQKRYELAPRTATKWTKQATLSDYKEHSQYRMGDFASLLKRQENGEYKQASVGEEKEIVQLEDYGRMYEFTAKMLVNDDLKALQILASESGVAAARLENKLCYDVLAYAAGVGPTMGDNKALFDATAHNNLAASGAAISETTIGAMWKNMRQQETVDGEDKLNLTPSIFLCGPAQEIAARKFFSAVAATQTSDVNIFQNSMEIIVDAAISGNEYYAIASPSLIDTVTLFKLEGQEGPQVSSRVKFETDALQLKVSHTAAAKPIDYRGIQKNQGQ